MNAPAVVAVIATCRRAPELQRLLDSLARIPRGLLGVVVVDNGADDATRQAVAASALAIEHLPQSRNLGCGGGLAAGERAAVARFGPAFTHLWILDDDAVVELEALEILVAAMERAGAGVAHPLVVDSAGRVGWSPGLLDRRKQRALRDPLTPAQYAARCGLEPVPFSWSQGIALLVTRPALEAVGFHRDDYWVRGEDLEFSLRLTARFPGIYVPAARVRHLPPEGDPIAARAAEYPKHRAMLQNIAYTALRLPHGRRIARTIPSNWLRFLRTWGWTPHVMGDAFAAFFRGAIFGEPAGARPRIQS